MESRYRLTAQVCSMKTAHITGTVKIKKKQTEKTGSGHGESGSIPQRTCVTGRTRDFFVFRHPEHPDFYLVMADRWVPDYVMTKTRYEQLERVIVSQRDKSIQPSEEDYRTAMEAPFLSAANTSVAAYVWLPLTFEDGMPVIRWQDEWNPEEILKGGCKTYENI